MQNEKIKILCFSRSYLAFLLPKIGEMHTEAEYFHIVQNYKEQRQVESRGQNVILNLEKEVRDKLKNKEFFDWAEPDDFRVTNDFYASALYSDRYLKLHTKSNRESIAKIIFNAISRIFIENNFNYFLSEPVAIFTTHIIFYHCKKYDTKVRLWCPAYFPDFFYFVDDIRICNLVINKIQKIDEETENAIRTFSKNVIDDKAGPNYHFKFAGKQKVSYFNQRKGTSTLILNPGIKSISIQFLRYFRAKFLNLFFPMMGDHQAAVSKYEHRFYLSCLLYNKNIYDAIPNESEENILFPLQYEPEASLDYMSSNFFDQYATVEFILRNLPSNKILWVKEHPNQFGALSIKKWKNLKYQYGNVRFVFGRDSGRVLMKKCKLVIVISSSAGMDALLLGKKVCVLGNVYYDTFDGAVKITSNEALSDFLNSKYSYQHDGNDFEKNVSRLLEISNKSYPGNPAGSNTTFSADNLNKLLFAVKNEFV